MKLSHLVALAFLACTAGCLSSSQPVAKAWMVEPRTDLPAPAAPAEGSASAFTSTRLGSVTVNVPYDRAQFVVRRADGSVAFDPYNVFAAPPATLLRAPLNGRLAADGRFGHVVAQTSSAHSDAQVEVRVKDLSLDCRETGRKTARAAVALDVVRTGSGPRAVTLSGEGAGTAEVAPTGDYSAAFSTAVDAAIERALQSLKK